MTERKRAFAAFVVIAIMSSVAGAQLTLMLQALPWRHFLAGATASLLGGGFLLWLILTEKDSTASQPWTPLISDYFRGRLRRIKGRIFDSYRGASREVQLHDAAWMARQLQDAFDELDAEYRPEHRIQSLLLAIRAYNPLYEMEMRRHLKALEQDRGRDRIEVLQAEIDWLLEWHRIWHTEASPLRWALLTNHRLTRPASLRLKLNPPR